MQTKTARESIHENVVAEPDLQVRCFSYEDAGVRVPGAIDAPEMLLRAMIGQQISVASARTLQGRLTAELGEPVRVVEVAL